MFEHFLVAYTSLLVVKTCTSTTTNHSQKKCFEIFMKHNLPQVNSSGMEESVLEKIG